MTFGVVLADGPLKNVTHLTDTQSLDKIGTASFEIPAADPRTAYIGAGANFQFTDLADGYLGEYLYKSKTLSESQGLATLHVECYDVLRELALMGVGFRRVYSVVDVATVIPDLVALAPGWTATTDAGIGFTTVTYEGESIIAAVDVLRDRWNQHYRMTADRVLEFGAFGTSSGMLLTNPRGQEQAAFARNLDVAIVDNLKLVDEADEIANCIIPLGAGQGVDQITIGTATLGTYTVHSAANQDGSLYYYIQDDASVAAYGRRWKVLSFPQIRPVTNNAASITAAANALKLSAEAYIARHLAPLVSFGVTLRTLRKSIHVGDTVRLFYRGIVDGYDYLDVDEDFFVMDVTRDRDVNGSRTATLTIASIASRRTSDSDVMLEVVSNVNALRLHVATSLTHSISGPYTLRMDATHTAPFSVTFGNEVLGMQYAKLRFSTHPLRSSVKSITGGSSSITTTASGGSATPTSSAGGAQTSSSGGAQTSSSGGGATVTSGSGLTAHAHDFHIAAGVTGETMLFTDGGTGTIKTISGGYLQTSTEDLSHTHGVTVSNHTHTVSDHTHTVSDHTHSVTIAAHDHGMAHTHTTTGSYGIYEDTGVYPTGISVTIDGVDRTAALGGPWAAAGGALTGTEVDITAYLSTNLQANHTIEFSCASSQGEIEASVRVLLTLQAIAVAP